MTLASQTERRVLSQGRVEAVVSPLKVILSVAQMDAWLVALGILAHPRCQVNQGVRVKVDSERFVYKPGDFTVRICYSLRSLSQ
jgi:hypothetical protein